MRTPARMSTDRSLCRHHRHWILNRESHPLAINLAYEVAEHPVCLHLLHNQAEILTQRSPLTRPDAGRHVRSCITGSAGNEYNGQNECNQSAACRMANTVWVMEQRTHLLLSHAGRRGRCFVETALMTRRRRPA